ncbi:MAG: class II fumarate hydratase [Chloroflexi bacterium]|nr:class II fumarate hydratase [Chloroflexota bacterium]
MPSDPKYRIERDSMGEMEVPADAYYGASTARAVRNFPVSGLRWPRVFLHAVGLIKLAAARVNTDLGLLKPEIGNAIGSAAREVADGKFDDHFVVDIFQTGSGTSTNMNANEVIANRAGELLGAPLGSKRVHPNDHVNLGQSSNDVIPTAIHLSAAISLKEKMVPAMQELEKALRQKSDEFWPVIKTGRTHLQDAVPIRLGQEFLGYAGQVERCLRRLRLAQDELSEVALGGTAVGTGFGAHPQFAGRVCQLLTELTGIAVRETDNHFQAQSTVDGVVAVSGALRGAAISLMKVANDIRWMGSGPRTGLGELSIPAVQPGSSIMPGKVNPVIAESLIQVGAQVIGNDAAIAVAGQGGYFELNLMMPVAGYYLLLSMDILAAGSRNFIERCLKDLKAADKGPAMVEQGLMLATALAKVIGYDAAAEIAKEAARTGETIRQVARRRTKLTEEQLKEILDPVRMTEPTAESPIGGSP